MGTVLLVIDIILAISITILVLMQRSEGGALGALGGGTGSSMFTGRQAGNFLTRTTWWLFGLFVVVNLALVILSKKTTEVETISLVPMTETAAQARPSAPVAPAAVPAQPVVPAQLPAGE